MCVAPGSDALEQASRVAFSRPPAPDSGLERLPSHRERSTALRTSASSDLVHGIFGKVAGFRPMTSSPFRPCGTGAEANRKGMGGGLECVGVMGPVDPDRAVNTAIKPCLAALAVEMGDSSAD